MISLLVFFWFFVSIYSNNYNGDLLDIEWNNLEMLFSKEEKIKLRLLSSAYSSIELLPNLFPDSRWKQSYEFSPIFNGQLQEDLPPTLDSTSELHPVFEGTTREKIKLVPFDIHNRRKWLKEKVYSTNKVPALEHNNEVKEESLDLIKYINTNFEGPSFYRGMVKLLRLYILEMDMHLTIALMNLD
ncbi:hypothetical protein Lser_V15G34420 [Lactuca serriola]